MPVKTQLSIGNNGELPPVVFLGKGLLEEYGLGGDIIQVRGALDAWKGRFLYMAGEFEILSADFNFAVEVSAHQYQASPWSAGLVGAGCGEMGMVYWRGVCAGYDEACNV